MNWSDLIASISDFIFSDGDVFTFNSSRIVSVSLFRCVQIRNRQDQYIVEQNDRWRIGAVFGNCQREFLSILNLNVSKKTLKRKSYFSIELKIDVSNWWYKPLSTNISSGLCVVVFVLLWSFIQRGNCLSYIKHILIFFTFFNSASLQLL